MLGAGAAGTAAAAGPASSAPTWAYGAVHQIEVSGQAGLYRYAGSATVGFSAIFEQVENATGVVTVHVVRTIGAIVVAHFCLVSCLAPRAYANYTFHTWERTDAWANLTTHASVVLDGAAVPALGLLNSSVGVTAKLVESETSYQGAVVLTNQTLTASIVGAIGVALAPALGLFPLNLTPATTWNSSAAFTTSGGYQWAWSYVANGSRLSPVSVGNHGDGNLSAHGTVGASGSYPAGAGFAFHGVTYPAVNLTLAGPFVLDEGVFLLPQAAELLESASEPWEARQNGSTVVTETQLDLRSGGWYQGHLPIVASGYGWASAAPNAASGVAVAASIAPLSTPAPAPNATFVQGQPESVAGAQSTGQCLVSGLGCAPAGPAAPPYRLLFLAGVGSVAALVIALAVVARRRPPRPAYPNARLYPPGGGSTAGGLPSPPPAPAEEDPLGHLW